MASVKDVFKDEFNENVKEDYKFLIINKDDVSYIRIINNVEQFKVIFMHINDNILYLCNSLNKKFFKTKKCKHCNENINNIKMIFTNIIKCDINGNIIDDKPKIWFIPKYKFNDVFLPFHKKTKKDYIMYDYIFKVERNINDFHKISNTYKPINVSINDLSLDESIKIIKDKYIQSNDS